MNEQNQMMLTQPQPQNNISRVMSRTTMGGKPVFEVPAKTIINFKSGFATKLLCDGPTFTAGTACAYSCSFCFVPAIMKKQEPWLKEHGVTGEHMDVVVRRKNASQIAAEQLRSKPKAFLQQKLTIYASPLVDVAANMDLVNETVEICAMILFHTNWDIRLLSKSNLLPKVAQALETLGGTTLNHRGRIIYGVSTGTLDDKLAAAFEEGCPKVSKRIESLHWLQDNGYRTFAMVCPSLPMETETYDLFAAQCAEQLRYDRCEHVWAEVINVRGDSFKRTHKRLVDAGFLNTAARLKTVSEMPAFWEAYAQATFLAHRRHCPPEKLRFLQYVNKHNEVFWKQHVGNGAILL